VVRPDQVPFERTIGPVAPLPTEDEGLLYVDVDRAVLLCGGQSTQAQAPGARPGTKAGQCWAAGQVATSGKGTGGVYFWQRFNN
jgi:hypothetical protein